MGMFDHVVVLDEKLSCPHGHRVGSFQTKSFGDASMDTYLVDGRHVHRVGSSWFGDADDAAGGQWIVKGHEAVFQRRHTVEPVVPSHEVTFYTACGECAPVLVRRDYASTWGDLVDERRLWVEFRATFNPDGLQKIERTSGTRDDLVTELRREGLRVIGDDEPLAIAHRELRAARDTAPPRRSRARR
jgi:hypothetical protein